MPAATPSPEDHAAERQRLAVVARCIDRLEVAKLRFVEDLPEKEIEKAREALDGKSKYTWLSENWQEFFEPVTIEAGVATLERVEILAGLAENDQVALEDPTRKRVERDDETN